MKQKGFTLIELLAVIVILAIIALIATPIVLNIIKDSKENAGLRSAEFYLDAVEHSITKKMMNDPTFKPSSCDVQSDGNLKCNETLVKVEVKGEVPTSGTIDFDKGKITEVSLTVNDKAIVKQNNKLVYLKSGLYDAEGNLIATWDELVKAGIDLEKDVVPQVNENEEITNLSEFPGVILSNDEKLKQGTKLVIDSSVTKIGFGALVFNTTIKEIIIPNSVTSIGDSAFGVCTSLEKVTIPNSVTSIGDSAFDECTNLKEITIPNSVTSIGAYAFSGCTGLEKITIPNSVTSIGDNAFSYCTSLEKIIIGNNVTIIEDRTFDECTNLKEITIPRSILKIKFTAFYGCTSLTTINYTGTQEQWNAISKVTDWDRDTPADKVINYNYVIPQN